MAKRRAIADPVRQRVLEMIDDSLAAARDNVQTAKDLAELLNALGGDEKIEVDGNVVYFPSKQEAEKDAGC